MATPKWQPGKLYLPGALVQPRSVVPPVSTAITNAGFETGDATDWTLGAGASVSATDAFTGSYGLKLTGSAGVSETIHDAYPVAPGTVISGACMYRQGAASSGHNTAAVSLYWYDSGMTLIRRDGGSLVSSGSGGTWHQSTINKSAPSNAAYVAIGLYTNRDDNAPSAADNFTWNYASATAPAGLIYKAVQPAAGLSDDVEPNWPLSLGIQVIDNQVIWEAVIASRVVWQASPILKSGAVEPNPWPEAIGAYTPDGTIKWRTISRRVEDPKCPNSKVVAIMASKVFAVDKDIVRFCATTNPLDWTSADNAGYLATGIQQSNANDMAVLAPYRGNLVALNASSFQNWQVDPDPAAMALLDQMEGIGSTWQQAAQPVAGELIYLSQLGFRTVSIAAGTNSLAAGDVGMPIDPLVQAAIASALATGSTPVSTYYPSQGQFWGAVPNYPVAGQTTAFVLTMNGGKGKWSRYLFPFAIEAFAQLGDDLYVRNGDQVSRVSEDAVADDIVTEDGVEPVEFGGTVWWPWLDFGQPGVTKMLQGIDLVASGTPSISIGYDQRNLALFTDPYEIPADTLPGGMIPFPVSAPTLSVRVDFAPGEKWSLQCVDLYLSDFRLGS